MRIFFSLFIFIFFSILVHGEEPESRPPAGQSDAPRVASTLRDNLAKKLWAELYFQTEYSSHDDDNIIFDAWAKQGYRLYENEGRFWDVYIKERYLIDDNRDYWNNRVEAALGTRLKPFRKYGLILFLEGIWGAYTERQGADPNEDTTAYTDLQAGYAFWQWLGRYLWQAEGAEFFAPFTGWREVYSDGIYYNRDNHNYIVTFDYKEGLMLGNFPWFNMDAFAAFQAGIDTQGDYWNNYLEIGPGIRFQPIKSLDMKISFEYFFGHYYTGHIHEDNEDAFYRDFAITLSFWADIRARQPE
ncbi:MAG: hypothetical protein ACLFUS_01015 [Candidatus Sumerlaeia bacterium]